MFGSHGYSPADLYLQLLVYLHQFRIKFVFYSGLKMEIIMFIIYNLIGDNLGICVTVDSNIQLSRCYSICDTYRPVTRT